MKKHIVFIALISGFFLSKSFAAAPVPVIKSVSASSQAAEKYSAKNIIDGTWTSWVEGAGDEGIGESIELEFEKPTVVNHICIRNGFGNLLYYWANNRIESCEIIFDGDNSTKITKYLFDTSEDQFIFFDDYIPRTKIKLTIRSVYKGSSSDNDTCISEIAVNTGIITNPRSQFRYDPERARMLKALRTIEVGEKNVQLSKDGLVQSLSRRWNDSSESWMTDSGKLDGMFNKGYSSSADGRHSYTRFQIFLNPNGKHILATAREEFSGNPNLYPYANEKIYIWDGKDWNLANDDPKLSKSENIRELFTFKEKLESRELPYEVYVANHFKNDYDNVFTFSVQVPLKKKVSTPEDIVYVDYVFRYDGEKFLPYYEETNETKLVKALIGFPPN